MNICRPTFTSLSIHCKSMEKRKRGQRKKWDYSLEIKTLKDIHFIMYSANNITYIQFFCF